MAGWNGADLALASELTELGDTGPLITKIQAGPSSVLPRRNISPKHV